MGTLPAHKGVSVIDYQEKLREIVKRELWRRKEKASLRTLDDMTAEEKEALCKKYNTTLSPPRPLMTDAAS